MTTEYQLLDDAGHSKPIGGFLASHRAFRRDAARFPVALRRLGTDPDGLEALRNHWKGYEDALVSHHQMEDGFLFPFLRQADPTLGEVLDELMEQHHALDTNIGQVQETLDRLPDPEAVEPAAQACEALATAVNEHLDLEEARVVPVMESVELPQPGGGGDSEGEGEGQGGGPPDMDFTFVMPWMGDGLPEHVVQALLVSLPFDVGGDYAAWQSSYEQSLHRWWP